VAGIVISQPDRFRASCMHKSWRPKWLKLTLPLASEFDVYWPIVSGKSRKFVKVMM
jgi:hypothetical protein